MNERRTASMLQRIPVILAVTAASYGLQLPLSAQRLQQALQPAKVVEEVKPGEKQVA